MNSNNLEARMKPSRTASGEEGAALLMVLFLLAVVAIVSLTAVAVSSNSALVNMYEDRQDLLEAVADAGIENGRALLNANPKLFPTTGYATLENGVVVNDVTGNAIPGVKRWTYAGPTGVSTGQYGVFGTLISITEAPNGTRLVRRQDVVQESFAKYAYFTDVEGNISFGGGDQISGPVHTNDAIQILNTGASFKGPGNVTTALTITGKTYATFAEGYVERVPVIPMPTTADLTRLKALADQGGTGFTAASAGTGVEAARMRIEFVVADLNANDTIDADEGFFRVYEGNDAALVMADKPSTLAGWTTVAHCGYTNSVGVFTSPKSLAAGSSDNQRRAVVQRTDARCYPDGDPRLNTGSVFKQTGLNGAWRRSNWTAPAAVVTRLAATRPDLNAAYLFPLNHDDAPNFKGVIHVAGNVALSGTLRGRVTLASTGTVYIVDDLQYSTGPGSPGCTDMLGLFSGVDVMIADNAINAPQQVVSSGPWYTYDESSSEFVNGVVLALRGFGVQDYDEGSTTAEPCEGRTWGRGCLYLSGGVIQDTRSPVGQGDGHGNLKRYSYDVCGYKRPPPYFPTTGHFGRSRYFEIDPIGFDVAKFYSDWAAEG